MSDRDSEIRRTPSDGVWGWRRQGQTICHNDGKTSASECEAQFTLRCWSPPRLNRPAEIVIGISSSAYRHRHIAIGISRVKGAARAAIIDFHATMGGSNFTCGGAVVCSASPTPCPASIITPLLEISRSRLRQSNPGHLSASARSRHRFLIQLCPTNHDPRVCQVHSRIVDPLEHLTTTRGPSNKLIQL